MISRADSEDLQKEAGFCRISAFRLTERNDALKPPSHPPGDMHNAYVDEKGISYTIYLSNPLHGAINKENDSQKKRELIMNNCDVNFHMQTGKSL